MQQVGRDVVVEIGADAVDVSDAPGSGHEPGEVSGNLRRCLLPGRGQGENQCLQLLLIPDQKHDVLPFAIGASSGEAVGEGQHSAASHQLAAAQRLEGETTVSGTREGGCSNAGSDLKSCIAATTPEQTAGRCHDLRVLTRQGCSPQIDLSACWITSSCSEAPVRLRPAVPAASARSAGAAQLRSVP